MCVISLVIDNVVVAFVVEGGGVFVFCLFLFLLIIISFLKFCSKCSKSPSSTCSSIGSLVLNTVNKAGFSFEQKEKMTFPQNNSKIKNSTSCTTCLTLCFDW